MSPFTEILIQQSVSQIEPLIILGRHPNQENSRIVVFLTSRGKDASTLRIRRMNPMLDIPAQIARDDSLDASADTIEFQGIDRRNLSRGG